MIDTKKPIYDHLRYGKDTVFFIPPPKNVDKDTFGEELPTIAVGKIIELQARLEEIETDYKKQEPVLLSNKIDISLNIPYLVARFGYEKEKYYISRWIKYWKDLAGVKDVALPQEKLNVNEARNFPIEDLYEGNLRRVRNRLQGLCPFHEEKTPSFFIFPDNHFHCFGCNEHGSSIDFLMKTKKLDFVSAVKELQR